VVVKGKICSKHHIVLVSNFLADVAFKKSINIGELKFCEKIKLLHLA
jgi:hypothetical protein